MGLSRNTPHHKKFEKLRSEDWRMTYRKFQEQILVKAKKKDLDHKALKQCLTKVLKMSGRNAYVPISAHTVTLDGKQVWIVVITWEHDQKNRPQHFGHIWIYAIEAKSLKVIGSKHCC